MDKGFANNDCKILKLLTWPDDDEGIDSFIDFLSTFYLVNMK